MARITFSLSKDGHGEIQIDVGEGVVTITETEFAEMQRGFAKFMAPTWEARAEAKRKAEIEEHEAKMAAARHTIMVDGVAIVVQTTPAGHHFAAGDPYKAWLDGFTEEDSPFFINKPAFGSRTRPWGLKLPKGTGIHGTRAEYCGESGNPIYFGSIEAAARRAIKMELHKNPA